MGNTEVTVWNRNFRNTSISYSQGWWAVFVFCSAFWKAVPSRMDRYMHWE